MNETEILKLHGYVYSLSDCDTSDSEDDPFITYGGKEVAHAINNSGRSSSLSDFDDEYYAVQPPPIRIDDYKHLIVKIKAVNDQKDDAFSKRNKSLYSQAVRATEKKEKSSATTAVRNSWKKSTNLSTQDVESFRISLGEFPPLPQHNVQRRHANSAPDQNLANEGVNEISYSAIVEDFSNAVEQSVEDSVHIIRNCNGDAKNIPIAALNTRNKIDACEEKLLSNALNLNVVNRTQQLQAVPALLPDLSNIKSIQHIPIAESKIFNKTSGTSNNLFGLKPQVELDINYNSAISMSKNKENVQTCLTSENNVSNNLVSTQETEDLLLIKTDCTGTNNTVGNLQNDCTVEENYHNYSYQPEINSIFNVKNYKISQISRSSDRLSRRIDLNMNNTNRAFETRTQKKSQDVTNKLTERLSKCKNAKSQDSVRDNCKINKDKVNHKANYYHENNKPNANTVSCRGCLSHNKIFVNRTAEPTFKRVYSARDNRAALTRKRIAAGRRCKRIVQPSFDMYDLFVSLIVLLFLYLLYRIFSYIFL